MHLFKKEKRPPSSGGSRNGPNSSTAEGVFPEDYIFTDRQRAQQQRMQAAAQAQAAQAQSQAPPFSTAATPTSPVFEFRAAQMNGSGSNGSSAGYADWRGDVSNGGGSVSAQRMGGGHFSSPSVSQSGFSSSGSGSLGNSSTMSSFPSIGPAGSAAGAGVGTGPPRKSKLERLTGEDAPVLPQNQRTSGAPPTSAAAAIAVSNLTNLTSPTSTNFASISSRTGSRAESYASSSGAASDAPLFGTNNRASTQGSSFRASNFLQGAKNVFSGGSSTHGHSNGADAAFRSSPTAHTGMTALPAVPSPAAGASGGIGAGTSFGPKTSMLDTSVDETDCPVCLEPLSHRLAGEKPHVVPQCGHALHNACFTAVYGSPESVLATQKRNAVISAARAAGKQTSSNLAASQAPGMCGVCRRAIVLGGEGSRQSDKRAAKASGMMGMGGPSPFDAPSSKEQNEDEEDRLEHPGSYARVNSSNGTGGMVVPIVRAKPEYSTIYRRDPTGKMTKQNVVCVVSVEVPARRPLPAFDESYYSHAVSNNNSGANSSASHREQEYDQDDEVGLAPGQRGSLNVDASSYGTHSRANTYDSQEVRSATHLPTSAGDNGLDEVPEESSFDARTPGAADSARQQASDGDDTASAAGFSFGATPPAQDGRNDPFHIATEDLRDRILDWKGHTLEHFGPLHLFDALNVRQDSVVREFSVYLFQEALLCVTEERRRGFGKLVGMTEEKPGLKLKGRIYLRHIKAVRDSSTAGEYSLSIKMDDDHLDQFVLCFVTEVQSTCWRRRMEELVEYVRNPTSALAVLPAPSNPHGTQEKSAASSIGDANSDVQSEPSAYENPLVAAAASGMAGAASTSHNSHQGASQQHQRGTSSTLGSNTRAGSAADAASLAESTATRRSLARKSTKGSMADSVRRASSLLAAPKAPIVPLHQQWSASGGQDPSKPVAELLPHAPLDLVIIISVPAVLDAPQANVTASISSSAALKLRLIRSSLEFIVNNLGPTDRISLVSYSAGVDGQVRKTQFLQPSRETSRRKLHAFIEGMGSSHLDQGNGNGDPFLEDLSKLGGSSDRVDTVTAINVGLDVVLQRKGKNPTTGMILVNDTSHGPKRNQMDLVMARAEAANVPIHCFGYGKNHDPSSLWLISNHTRGTYTFIKEWFQLRECLTGCIGSLLSVAVTDVKVHISLPADNKFRVRKVSGVIGSIVSANGKDVDIELGYVHFGDVREFFVELEVDFVQLMAHVAPPEAARKLAAASKKFGAGRQEESTATDDFMARLGIEGISLDVDTGAGDMDAVLGNFIEEVAVLEVDAGFKDPATRQAVTRMVNPTILTMEVDSASQDPTIAAGENSAAVAASLAEPTVTRRRIEILVSDMITRSLLLVSRNNHAQAQRILTETRRVVETVVDSIPLPAQELSAAAALRARSGAAAARVGGPRRQRELLHAQTLESLNAILDDLDTLIDGLENSKQSFERDTKNFGAQQAMVLRDQKAWTTRTNTEFIRFRDDNGSAFAALAYMHSLPGRA